MVPWPATADQYVIYIIDVQRCNELGIKLYQNSTAAVLSSLNIPPECVSKVIDFKGNELFVNTNLNQTAPGDRKANLDVGAAIQRAVVYIELTKEMPADSGESATAIQDRGWHKSYDRTVHDEQMCSKCFTLSRFPNM